MYVKYIFISIVLLQINICMYYIYVHVCKNMTYIHNVYMYTCAHVENPKDM